eukprot:2640504-Prymnesium_polylepis.1
MKHPIRTVAAVGHEREATHPRAAHAFGQAYPVLGRGDRGRAVPEVRQRPEAAQVQLEVLRCRRRAANENGGGLRGREGSHGAGGPRPRRVALAGRPPRVPDVDGLWPVERLWRRHHRLPLADRRPRLRPGQPLLADLRRGRPDAPCQGAPPARRAATRLAATRLAA